MSLAIMSGARTPARENPEHVLLFARIPLSVPSWPESTGSTRRPLARDTGSVMRGGPLETLVLAVEGRSRFLSEARSEPLRGPPQVVSATAPMDFVLLVDGLRLSSAARGERSAPSRRSSMHYSPVSGDVLHHADPSRGRFLSATELAPALLQRLGVDGVLFHGRRSGDDADARDAIMEREDLLVLPGQLE